MSTLLCVPITVREIHDALADSLAARHAGADLVEFRVDEYYSAESGQDAAITGLVQQCPLPCIVTCRGAAEGGAYDGDEQDRVSLYEFLGRSEHPPRYIDFEFAAYAGSENIKQKINLAIAHDKGRTDLQTSLILSNHDFAGRPADLTRRILQMRSHPAARILKIAFRARSLRDNLELFDILVERDRPMIALAMGEYGLMSRVLAPKFGGFLTFASLRPASATAPGQPTISDLQSLYRFRAIGPSTRVYGVVGYPVGHSLSPLVHNAGFEAVGFDAVYVPMPVAADPADPDAAYASFKATIGELVDHPRLDLGGLSVTIPHKEHLVRLALERGWEIDAQSRRCGAANTLVIDRPGQGAPRGRVINTDGPAVVACIRDLLGRGEQDAGRHAGAVAILGAGGVARSAAFALAAEGFAVKIFARNADRARDLAQAVARDVGGPAHWGVLADCAAAGCHAIVNCTPVGMRGGPDPAGLPILPEMFGNCQPVPAVLDTVYNPVRTPLLAHAADAGWQTMDGLSMFLRQAAAQFEAWTERKCPTALYQQLVQEAVGTTS